MPSPYVGHSEQERPLGSYLLLIALVNAPFQWISAAMVAGLTVVPRATRAVAAVFSVADALQLGWSRAREGS